MIIHNKTINYILLVWGILFFFSTFVYVPLKRKLITYMLNSPTDTIEGKLIGHETSDWFWYRGGYSVVSFNVDGKYYQAKTDRLKMKTGVPFMVKYRVDNPTWNRVVVPDSLMPYQSGLVFKYEEFFYTWPPTLPDGQKVNEGKTYGPY